STELKRIRLIHSFPSSVKSCFSKDPDLKICLITLKVSFSMYYFIVNDTENGTRSEIKHIFLCAGSFFAPNTTEEEAARYSKQIYPQDLGLELNLYRVKLRYRPFFECRTIKASSYGLYTSWSPKMLGLEKEAKQRKKLLEEVLK